MVAFPKVQIQNEVQIQSVVQIRNEVLRIQKVHKVVFPFPFPMGMEVYNKVLLPNLVHMDILHHMVV